MHITKYNKFTFSFFFKFVMHLLNFNTVCFCIIYLLRDINHSDLKDHTYFKFTN